MFLCLFWRRPHVGRETSGSDSDGRLRAFPGFGGPQGDPDCSASQEGHDCARVPAAKSYKLSPSEERYKRRSSVIFVCAIRTICLNKIKAKFTSCFQCYGRSRSYSQDFQDLKRQPSNMCRRSDRVKPCDSPASCLRIYPERMWRRRCAGWKSSSVSAAAPASTADPSSNTYLTSLPRTRRPKLCGSHWSCKNLTGATLTFRMCSRCFAKWTMAQTRRSDTVIFFSASE